VLPCYPFTNIDHTILKPTTTLADVERCCREAIEYRFAAVCIPPPYVKSARPALQGTGVKLATVIGFPFGYNAIESKLAECILAIIDGADELDMVINLSALKNADWGFLAQEINHILHWKGKDKVIKVIVESGILTREELKKCCELYGRRQPTT
jgi:deoxyribose-phosphate aldolase